MLRAEANTIFKSIYNWVVMNSFITLRRVRRARGTERRAAAAAGTRARSACPRSEGRCARNCPCPAPLDCAALWWSTYNDKITRCQLNNPEYIMWYSQKSTTYFYNRNVFQPLRCLMLRSWWSIGNPFFEIPNINFELKAVMKSTCTSWK